MASRAGSWDDHPSEHKEGKGAGKKPGIYSDMPLIDRAKERASELYDGLELDRRVEKNPVGMLAAAWGIGFVLGGGLTTGLARRALEMGARAGMKLLLPMIADKAWSMTRNAAAGSSRTRRGGSSNQE